MTRASSAIRFINTGALVVVNRLATLAGDASVAVIDLRRALAPGASPADGPDTGAGPSMPGVATPAEVARFAVMRSPDADAEFARLMLAHHLGGLHMVEEVIRLAERPEVVALAQHMRTDQQRE
jgi:uncharacterized protein (DUF305 family)